MDDLRKIHNSIQNKFMDDMVNLLHKRYDIVCEELNKMEDLDNNKGVAFIANDAMFFVDDFLHRYLTWCTLNLAAQFKLEPQAFFDKLDKERQAIVSKGVKHISKIVHFYFNFLQDEVKAKKKELKK